MGDTTRLDGANISSSIERDWEGRSGVASAKAFSKPMSFGCLRVFSGVLREWTPEGVPFAARVGAGDCSGTPTFAFHPRI